jgi:hypothetical protein
MAINSLGEDKFGVFNLESKIKAIKIDKIKKCRNR